MRPPLLALALLAGLVPAPAGASDLVAVSPLTDRVVLLHFADGRVEHHARGQSRSDEKVVTDPLDVTAADRPETYAIASGDDLAYAKPVRPVRVGRKSKGTDFAWFADAWEDNRAVNRRPDHTKEHWLYLVLPSAMIRGKTYRVATGTLAKNGAVHALTFDEAKARSEMVHVNAVGYTPSGPKVASVFHWAGTLGGIALEGRPGRGFRVLDDATGAEAFAGKVRFRLPATAPEAEHRGDSPPHGNFLGADTFECDFTPLSKPGRYRVAVEGVGCSFPFTIHPDVYREVFCQTARALYHNRSGVELKMPFTEFARPAPHHPGLTPGFAGKLQYTAARFRDWGSEGGDRQKLEAGMKGSLDSWGWYQDAGDWDAYESHLRVATELLFAYELAPGNFRDGELNIPESGNGVPDILDEAAWLPRFGRRLRAELVAKKYGTGGLGLRVSGDAFGGDEKALPGGKKVGQGSWEDVNRVWVASGEDAGDTYRYAGACAHLAHCLKLAGKPDPEGADWAQEAQQAFDWAAKNARPGDDQDEGFRAHRAYAAASLFRLAGDAKYEAAFLDAAKTVRPGGTLDDAIKPAAWVYALGDRAGNPADLARVRGAVIATADLVAVETPARRALRWGGSPSMPMLIGQQTTPLVLDAAIARHLVRDSDPLRAERYATALSQTCDYVLGNNSLNTTWVTGVGPRSPSQVFHMDAWYNGKGRFHPGLIPYGPWRKTNDRGQGPWDVDWANATVTPPIDSWPGNERWFSNRCCPLTGEFTVHQTLAPAAAVFGLLCAPAP